VRSYIVFVNAAHSSARLVCMHMLDHMYMQACVQIMKVWQQGRKNAQHPSILHGYRWAPWRLDVG